MPEENEIKLQWQDIILKYTLLKLIPSSVKPNHLTILRFFLTPLVVLVIIREKYLWGIFLFLLTAFTDTLDGSLARTRKQISEWGKLYDPLADKFLIGSLVLAVVFRYLNFYLAITLVIIEIIFIIGAWYRRKKGLKVEADFWGKIKMNLQVLGILILLLAIFFDWPSFFQISSTTFYLAIVFAVISLFSHGV